MFDLHSRCSFAAATETLEALSSMSETGEASKEKTIPLEFEQHGMYSVELFAVDQRFVRAIILQLEIPVENVESRLRSRVF